LAARHAYDQHVNPNFSLFLQAAGSLRTLTDAWGTVEAAVAAGLHDMLATMLAALPWDDNAHAVAYRHMPEVRSGGACLLCRRFFVCLCHRCVCR
jgi:hypothetical protein